MQLRETSYNILKYQIMENRQKLLQEAFVNQNTL